MDSVVVDFRKAKAGDLVAGVRAFLSCFSVAPHFEVYDDAVCWNDDEPCHECRPEQIFEVLQGAVFLKQRPDCTPLEREVAGSVFTQLKPFYKAALLEPLEALERSAGDEPWSTRCSLGS